MKKIGIAALVSAGLLMVGCIDTYNNYDEADDRFQQLEDFTGGFSGNLELRDGSLDGEIGQVRLNNPSADLNGFDDSGFAYVEVLGAGDNGVGMNVVELNGGIDALEPGFEGTFAYDDYFEADAGELRVMSLGCSGDEAYAWDYDQPASETEIAVIEVEDGLQVDYTSRTEAVDPMTGVSTGEMQSSTGSFVVVR